MSGRVHLDDRVERPGESRKVERISVPGGERQVCRVGQVGMRRPTLQDVLFRLVRACAQPHATCGAVHSDFDHIVQQDGAWRALPRFHRHHRDQAGEGAVFAQLLQRNFIQTCTLAVRTALVRAYLASPLPADSYRVVDWPLCLFVGASHGIRYLDRPTATYRRTPGSATNRRCATCT